MSFAAVPTRGWGGRWLTHVTSAPLGRVVTALAAGDTRFTSALDLCSLPAVRRVDASAGGRQVIGIGHFQLSEAAFFCLGSSSHHLTSPTYQSLSLSLSTCLVSISLPLPLTPPAQKSLSSLPGLLARSPRPSEVKVPLRPCLTSTCPSKTLQPALGSRNALNAPLRRAVPTPGLPG